MEMSTRHLFFKFFLFVSHLFSIFQKKKTKKIVIVGPRQVPWVPETFLARFPVQSLARLNHLVQFGKFGKSMISNVLEGFDGVDKLKAMSKQVEYLISFNAIKLLSPIQLLQQYGLSFTNFLFQTITTCFEIVCIDGLGI